MMREFFRNLAGELLDGNPWAWTFVFMYAGSALFLVVFAGWLSFN